MENNKDNNVEVKEQQVAVQVENKAGSKKKTALIIGGMVVLLASVVGTAAYFHWAKKTKTDEFEECK